MKWFLEKHKSKTFRKSTYLFDGHPGYYSNSTYARLSEKGFPPELIQDSHKIVKIQ